MFFQQVAHSCRGAACFFQEVEPVETTDKRFGSEREECPAEHTHEECEGCLIHFERAFEGDAEIAQYESDNNDKCQS